MIRKSKFRYQVYTDGKKMESVNLQIQGDRSTIDSFGLRIVTS
jgi:hypothetical protein